MPTTHFSALVNKKRRIELGPEASPILPENGDFFFDSLLDRWNVFYNGQWWSKGLTTTTSTSSSTTTTSTSTTSTSTSSSTTTSTSTSTSTSTTTTL